MTVAGLSGLLALTISLATGCTQVVSGVGIPVPATTTPETTTPADSPDPPAVSGPRSPLNGDVIADECLLDAGQLGELVGEPVLVPTQATVDRDDGSSGSACYVDAATRPPAPVVAINVYVPQKGTPADFIRAEAAGGRRELDGVGEAATLVDIGVGTTLHLAGTRYLVTITVLGDAPPDDAWRSAATAALARLPS
ncbi:MAG: hypothetical protein ACRDRH_19265 [Pseudonocardia sp.]